MELNTQIAANAVRALRDTNKGRVELAQGASAAAGRKIFNNSARATEKLLLLAEPRLAAGCGLF